LRAAGEADFIVKQVQKYSPAAQAIFGAAVGRRAADIEGTLADATLSFELSADHPSRGSGGAQIKWRSLQFKLF
jgi:hypothetical protein